MNNVIIGSAGHVDHGKTSLIKALTGIDADRLMEEKKRGITIDLGFAYMDIGEGERVGIVDVPGHERFIRNMLAGTGGIDIALLVVAADEGVMPQTKEHLDILSLLNIKRGIVAVTKIDLVDSDWLSLMMEDLKEGLKDSFLKNAEIIPVSSKTGEGLDNLKAALIKLVRETESKNINIPFRLPIDRVFTKQGFGTVITGTLTEGSLSEGDELTIYPMEIDSKVRSIQVHSRDVKTAYAGQRVAVNLLKVKTEDIEKGAVLAMPNSMSPSSLIDVRITVLKDANREIANGSRVHFYHGSSEGLAKLILLDGKSVLLPNESGYAQLLLSEPIAAKTGDPFVLRFYSPLETIGGGIVLDPNPQKHKKGSKDAIKKLNLISEGDEEGHIEGLVIENSRFAPTLKKLSSMSGLLEADTKNILAKLESRGAVCKIGEDIYIHRDFVENLYAKLERDLKAFHEKEPLKSGMRMEELIRKRLDSFTNAQKESLLDILIKDNKIKKAGNLYADKDFELALNEKQLELKAKLMDYLMKQGFSPNEKSKILQDFVKEKETERLLNYLVDTGELLALNPESLFPRQTVEKALELFVSLSENGVALSDFRDAIESSRKYALLLLEYFDQKGISRKDGETRVLLKKQL